MRHNHLTRWFYFLFIISFLSLLCIEGKGFGGGRGGGGGFKSGSGGSFGGSKGTGILGGSSGQNRMNTYGSYNNMNKPRSGSNFKSNAMSFGAGALGGIAAYSLMRSMSSSYHSGPGYYQAGYGIGEKCFNNEDMNGTKFGEFRCPLNGFPYEAKYCCDEPGKQYCCIREEPSRISRSNANFGWILLVILILIFVIFLWARHRRQKSLIMIPMEPPANEQQGPPFYHPQPPPMGYPPPPTGNPYAVPPTGNPYAVPPQNLDGNFNHYPQQYQMPYPPQQQQQQQTYNPYQVKETGPPAYDDAIRYNQGIPSTKPI